METQNHNVNSLAIAKTAWWFKSWLYSLHTKSFMLWLKDLSCSSNPQELDHKFRSCSGAVRLRENLPHNNPHHPPLTLKPFSTSAPYTYPRQPFRREHASGVTGICRREAGRDDPADFRSPQFLAEEGLFSKQAEEPRRFTRAPVTTRWFVFARPLICLDSILSEGLVS